MLKNSVAWLWEELVTEKQAVGDVLEARIRAVDAQMEAVAGDSSNWSGADREGAVAPSSKAVGGTSVEQLHWNRFSLLREWVRLSIPARGDFIH